jgi:Flp pilus assembly protein TadB
MDEEEEERLENIIDEVQGDVTGEKEESQISSGGASKSYKEYKEEEKKSQEKTRYEKFCYKSASVLSLKAGEEVQEKLNQPLKLLGWEITPGMVLSASIAAFAISFASWLLLFFSNMVIGSALEMGGGVVPFSLMIILMIVPFFIGGYTFYKPIFDAKNKVIQSSGEMILSVLYMVVYMRSSPNLEGAVRFAALNLKGPISKDLKGILWSLEVGEFKRIDDALEHYTERWKGYNKDYLESLNLLRAATEQGNPQRREELLQDAIDNILDGTQEKMKHYAQSLKTPVMILNAVGALLPVLGMIMLPLISTFLGGAITPMHLIILFNIMLPGFLWWFMQRTLSSRPPTVDTKVTDDENMPERFTFLLEGENWEKRLPSWPFGVGVGLILASFGLITYLAYPHFFPIKNPEIEQLAPSILTSGEGLNNFMMLMRSLSIVSGIGFAIGITLTLGNFERQKAEDKLREMEGDFPSALFELGNKISGGTPIEVALNQAKENMEDLTVSELFEKSSRNIQDMGMTFEESIFDPNYGALKEYPSQMIETVMKAILESSSKGTQMASSTMMTISRYLKNIHKTQERLNDLMEETTTTILMLAYMLGPVVSGVAVGMSQTIISGLFQITTEFEGVGSQVGGNSTAGGGGLPGGGLPLNVEGAIPPELLQFVVGFYLIQLLYILGTFYTKITHGEDPTFRYMFTGKIMISGMFFYSMVVIIISMLFGNIISGVATGL